MSNTNPAIQFSDSEWEILKALWAIGEDATAREIHTAVADKSWSYSTVRTLLDRLEHKGAIARDDRPRQHRYCAKLDQKTAQSSALRRFAARVFNGQWGAMAVHMVDELDLDAAEKRQLEAILEQDNQDAD